MADKDVPLLLRKRRDGSLCLMTADFPSRHEFSTTWLLEHTMSGEVAMSDAQIVLTLANGIATYDIDRSLMETVDEHGETHKLSTGYWGILSEQSHFAAPVLPDVPHPEPEIVEPSSEV